MSRALYILFLAGAALAHMSLWYPPPLGGARKANPLTTHVDDKMNFPLGCCDSEGAPTLASPGDCRGHLDLLDTEEGKPQVTWQPGQDSYFQLSDYTYTADAPGSTHYGGSCQVGFSTDKGQTWKVAASYHGNCPHRNEKDLQTFHFTVPVGMPSGPAVFAWIWLNREHESFMNCASVQIGQSSGNGTNSTQSKRPSSSTTRLNSLVKPNHCLGKERLANESGGANELPTLTRRDDWDRSEPTMSPWTHARHRHDSKYSRYRYMRALNQRKVHRQRTRLVEERALEACEWSSAPTMETSYYTTDAICAANAKLKNPESDNFEIGWSNACGIVSGDEQYLIKDIKCE